MKGCLAMSDKDAQDFLDRKVGKIQDQRENNINYYSHGSNGYISRNCDNIIIKQSRGINVKSSGNPCGLH